MLKLLCVTATSVYHWTNLAVQDGHVSLLHHNDLDTALMPGGASDVDELLPTSVRGLRHAFHMPYLSHTRVRQRSHLNPMASARKPLRRAQVQKRDWAHVVDVNKPMTNFPELVPDMAHKVSPDGEI